MPAIKHVFLTILLVLTSHAVWTQLYLKGLKTAEIDQYQLEADSIYNLGNYAEATVYYDSIGVYWKKALQENSTDSIKHNYIYASLKRCKGVYMQRKREEAQVMTLACENETRRLLGDDHILMAEAQHLLAFIYQRVDQDKAIKYGKKAYATKVKHLDANDNSIASTLDNLSGCYLYKQDFKTAIKYSVDALDIRHHLDPPNYKSLIGSYVNTSQVYFYLGQTDQCIKLLLTADSLCDVHLEPTHPYRLLANSHLARIYNHQGKYQLGLEVSLNTLKIKKEKYGLSPHLKGNYDNICSSYLYLGMVDKAFAYCDTVVQIINMTGTKVSLSAAINNLGNAETNPHKSLEYFRQAIALCPEDSECSEQKQATRYGNISTIYSLRGDFDTSLNYLLKAKDILENDLGSYGSILISTYRNLSSTYEKLGDKKSAYAYSKKAISLNKKEKRKEHFAASMQRELARLLSADNNMTEAESLIKKAIATEEKELGPDHFYTAKSYAEYGDILRKKKDYNKAIYYLEKSIQAKENSGKNYINKVYRDQLMKVRVYEEMGDFSKSQKALRETLQTIGFTSFEEDKIEYDIPEYGIWQSLETYIDLLKIDHRINGSSDAFLIQKIRTGIDLIDKLRSSYFFESSELEFQKSVRNFYDWSLEQQSKLYQNNPTDARLALLLETIEKSKSIALNRRFKINQSIEQKLIPEEVISKEKMIVYRYEKTAEKYRSIAETESDSLSQLYAQEMFDMQLMKEQFLDSLSTEYPKYYQNRYKQDVTSLADMKSLSKKLNRGFLIFHWGDSLLYRINITPEYENLTVSNHKPILERLIKFRSLLSDKQAILNEDDYHLLKEEYIKLGTQLYQDLVKQSDNKKLPEKISIITDGPMVHLTFEALLSESASNKMSYQALPYLLNQHNISYIGSATQFDKLNQEERNIDLDYLGFGPSYGKDQIASLTTLRGTGANSSLIENIKEIDQVASLFQGNKYTGATATESTFKSQINNSGLLHLAMHASINEILPMESYMSFAADTSIQDDGKLHVYEIAEMNLNKDLVVLSACETHAGESFMGEGVLGIARAFQIASCPNLVMSHWLVDDRSASLLIYNFFKGIKGGKDPSSALRQAKLSYIAKSSEMSAHPSYWATFSYYGNPESHAQQSGSNQFIYWIIAGLVFLGLLFFMRRKVSL